MNRSEQVKQSVGSALHEAGDDVLDTIATAVGGKNLVSLRPALEKTGLFKKIDFMTSPMPMFLLELRKGSKKVAIVNKVNAEDPDRVVGNLAIGYLG